MTDSIAVKTLFGYVVISDVFANNMQRLVEVMNGNLDLAICCAFFNTLYQRQPVTADEAICDPIVSERLNSMKAGILSQISKNVKAIKNEHKHQVVKAFLESNKPSEHGTVNEIAAKYGWSKSDVRRFKKDGILDQKIAEKN